MTSYSTHSQSADIMPPPDSQTTFLSLPLELRFHIYGYILIDKRHIEPLFWPAKHTMAPSILKTCKQIHNEASPILYSKNTFLLSEPELEFRWLLRIGRANIKLLRTIHISVGPVCDKPIYRFEVTTFWYKVLDHLAREATGLRHVHTHWAVHRALAYGAGKDLRFVRELGKIQGLQSMVVGGYYAMHWPRYLSEKMGVPVREEGPIEHEYQRGTEELFPPESDDAAGLEEEEEEGRLWTRYRELRRVIR